MLVKCVQNFTVCCKKTSSWLFLQLYSREMQRTARSPALQFSDIAKNCCRLTASHLCCVVFGLSITITSFRSKAEFCLPPSTTDKKLLHYRLNFQELTKQRLWREHLLRLIILTNNCDRWKNVFRPSRTYIQLLMIILKIVGDCF